MSVWKPRTWGDIATLEYGRALRDYRGRDKGVPVWGTNGQVGWTDIPQVDGPGVIIGRKGAYRGVHYSAEPFWVIDTAFYLKPRVPMDLRWAYYNLKLQDINSMDSGSAVPSTSRADFYALPVLVPPLPRQRAIADFLDVLALKASTSKRGANSATDLAEALLVQATATSGSTEKIRLSDAARWLSGGTPNTSNADYWGGDTPWISASSLRSFIILDSDRRLTEQGLRHGTRTVEAGATICVVRGMSLKTEFRVGIAARAVAFGQDCKALIAHPEVGANLLAYALRASRQRVLNLVDEAGHGTGRLDTERLGGLILEVPPAHDRVALERRLGALTELAIARVVEASSVEDLQSVLLPPLMKGMLTPPELAAGSGDVP
jgi:type I restriction enzyme S subunit